MKKVYVIYHVFGVRTVSIFKSNKEAAFKKLITSLRECGIGHKITNKEVSLNFWSDNIIEQR